LSLSGCGLIKKDSAAEGGGGGSAPAQKALSNIWKVSNEAWGYNFQGIPLNDMATAQQIVFADLSVCNCLISLNGTGDVGAYKIQSCLTSPSSSGMAFNTGCSVFHTTNGTYARSGASLCLKRNGGGTCSDLH
jgi:uncharacterized protein YceK